MSTKTTLEITADLEVIMAATAIGKVDRPVTWMQVRRALGVYLREAFGYDYFVKVRATRDDRIHGRIQVRALFAGADVSLTFQP